MFSKTEAFFGSEVGVMARRSIAWLLLLALAARGEIWTDRYGRKFEAELIEVREEIALFEFPSGSRFSLKVAELDPSARAKLVPRRVSGPQSRPATALPRTRNLGHPWPDSERHRGESRVEVISEDSEAGRFVYESPNYRFLCEVKLGDEVLRNFAVLFETAYRYCQRLPLSLESSGGGAERKTVLLFATEESYLRAGGPPGSAGCYSPGSRRVLAPLSSLGVEIFSGTSRLDRGKQNKVLVHELVHQLTPRSYYARGTNGWFTEGLADYVATTPYTWGYFQTDPHGRTVKSYVTEYGLKGLGGRGLGERIELPPLREFMTMSYSAFTGGDARRNYGVGLLLTHYFFHLDGQGKARRLGAYLRALDAGRIGEESYAALLDGRSWEELERDVAAAWKAKGITLVFGG